MLVIGAYFGRFVHSAGDFFIAGKALPFWAIGMSIVVSDIGATDFIAVAGGTYRYGLAQANFDWLGSMPALLVAAFLFVPFYWRSGVYTVPEFLGRRYNGAVQTVMAV
ncbi:MAG: sodium transporter, partial [Thermoanaerobaculia bacterium]|nr:sodium transporter [Thermoanaerobaculia bacterium]